MRKSIKTESTEPEQKKFLKPSEGEHLFQVVNVWDEEFPHETINCPEDKVIVKLEVANGEELGRTMLVFISLDPEWKGFFTTRLFLKAIQEPYKDEIVIDTDNWIGRMFYANVKHTDDGKYANIDSYSEKIYQNNVSTSVSNDLKQDEVVSPEDIAWDE